jgi:hypothetical protein
MQGGASNVPERIEMKNMAVTTMQDAPAGTGSIDHKNPVDMGYSKSEKSPPNIAGATGSGKGVDGSGDTKELDPDADVSSTTAPHNAIPA